MYELPRLTTTANFARQLRAASLDSAEFCPIQAAISISRSDYPKIFGVPRREVPAALLKFFSGNRIEPDWSCHPCHCCRFRLRHTSAPPKKTSRSPIVVSSACPRLREALARVAAPLRCPYRR